MPRKIGSVFAYPIALLATLWTLSSCNLRETFFPAKVTPVLVMEIELAESSEQAGTFDLVRAGSYGVHYRLDLRHGRWGESHQRFELSGVVTLVDANGDVRLTQPFHQSMLGYEGGGTLVRFESDSVESMGPYSLRVQLELVGSEFIDQHSKMTIYLKRHPPYALVD